MSLAREMSRGFFLKARLGVNGSQKALKSLGISARGAGLTAAGLFIGRLSFGRGLMGPDNGGGAPVCPVFRDLFLSRRRVLLFGRRSISRLPSCASPDPRLGGPV